MNGDVGRALYKRAGELGIPVGFLVSPHNYHEIETLAAVYPETEVIVDHFGHCVPSVDGSEVPEFEQLIAMARYPQINVKLSEFPRASNQEFPYVDMFDWVHRLIEECNSGSMGRCNTGFITVILTGGSGLRQESSRRGSFEVAS